MQEPRPQLRFRKLGGEIQPILERHDDFRALAALDKARWMASSVPTARLCCDPSFAALLDSDGDGQILAEDVQRAIDLAFDVLAAPAPLFSGVSTVKVDSLNLKSTAGSVLAAAAAKLIPGVSSFTPADVRKARDQRLAGLCLVGLDDARRCAFDAFMAAREAIDLYFDSCALLAVSGVQPAPLGLPQSSLELTCAALLRLPPAPPNAASEPLNLSDAPNTAHKTVLRMFLAASANLPDALRPDKDVLSLERWEAIKSHFKPFISRMSPDAAADKAAAIASGGDIVKEDMARLDELELLCLCQAHLPALARCMASFEDLYTPGVRSIFQAGSLVIDGRRLELVVTVSDLAAHKALAARSDICVIYVEASRGSGVNAAKSLFAAAVTAGGKRTLHVGKKGVLTTNDGLQWSAKIVEIIPNPVSLHEALWAPFTRMSEFAQSKFDQLAAGNCQDVEKAIERGLTRPNQGIATASTIASPQSQPWGGMGFLLLGGGVSIAALSTSFAFAVDTLKSLSALQLCASFGLLAIAFLAPMTLAAVMKLRRRSIGMFLEAGGCAVNAPMRLTFKTGRLFTRIPPLRREQKCKRPTFKME